MSSINPLQPLDGSKLISLFNSTQACEGGPLVLAAVNRSDEIRYKSSSGGMFYALASWAIQQGGIVYGCAFNNELRAVHIRCETLAECECCMGSKYSQSDMSNSITRVVEDLRAGRLVLFTGTPCQVAAVKHVADMRVPTAVKNLLTCDIVCHGTPSPALFASHIQFIEHERGKHVVSYWHRPKDKGHLHIEKIRYEDGTQEMATRLSDSWRRLFYDDRMLRPSCYSCPYTTLQRTSDITIADYWKIAGTPLASVDDGKGVSLVLASTAAGARVLGDLASTALNLYASCAADALPGNPMLARPTKYSGDRSEPWAELYKYGYESLMKRNRWYPNVVWYALRRIKNAVRKLVRRG